MPQHDAYARVSPYELALPGEEFAETHFPTVAREAEARGMDATDPGAFVMLGTVGQALKALQGPEDDPELIRQHGLVLFHAYHFQRAGEPLFLLDTHVARYLVETSPAGEGWSPSTPGPAGYVQLPQHLFWAEPVEDRPPESVDGFSWVVSEPGALHLLLALGLRDDRPGFSIVPLPAVPLEEAGTWAREEAREEGPDFESSLPGGELERLYSLETTGEVLKLTARTFWYLDTCPEAACPEEPTEPGPEPRPSALPYRRVRLTDERTAEDDG